MHTASKASGAPNREKGQTLALVTVMMLGLLGVTAIGIDVGYFFVVRNELQNVADGSALAGTRLLGSMYQELPQAQQAVFHCDEFCVGEIRDTVQALAGNNRAGGVAMSFLPSEIRIGQWDGNTDTFTETQDLPDAVDVVARRDGIRNGPVTTFFARIFGIDNAAISTIATAALSGQGTTVLGEVELPIGISKEFFDGGPEEFCKEDIVFHPTSSADACAGWTIWQYGQSSGGNTNTLKMILDEDDGFEGPVTIAGETEYKFTGGDAAAAFDNFLILFQKHGFATDASPDRNYILDNGDKIDWKDAKTTSAPVVPLLDSEGSQLYWPVWPPPFSYHDDLSAPRFYHKWETTVPIFDLPCLDNPSGELLIVGFAPMELTDVLPPPDNTVVGRVLCDRVSTEDTRGGGGEYGIKGSIPGLVR